MNPRYNLLIHAAILVIGMVSFWLAYTIRFDFSLPSLYFHQCLGLLPFVGGMKVCLFYLLRGHRADWRYIGLSDSYFGVYYSAISATILAFYSVLGMALPIPRGVIALDFLLTLLLVTITRATARALTEGLPVFLEDAFDRKRRKAIVIGAGGSAESIIREIKRNKEWRLKTVAIFDDEPSVKGMSIHGVSIEGSVDEIGSYVKRHPVDLAILAIPSPDPDQMYRINQALGELNIAVRHVPPILGIMEDLVSYPKDGELATPDLTREEIYLGGMKTPDDQPSGFIPIIRPSLPNLEDVFALAKESYDTGMVTVGKLARLFEEEARRFCNVEHAIAVSSGTSGLMLALAAMDLPDRAEVIVPSFTFAATVQVLHWNGLTPVYVDCLPGTMTIDPDEVEKAIGPRTGAIYPVTMYGLPPDLGPLEEMAQKYGLPLVCDSAQGLGSTYRGRRAGGFGLCEVFSLSPGKAITAMEGGLITTNDRQLADKLRSMRDCGKGPDGEEMVFKGLSARMIEFDSAVGLLNLQNADSLIRARLQIIQSYRERLGRIPGCRMQEFPSDRTPSGSLFAFLLTKDAAMDRDSLMAALRSRRIQTRRYFYPPVHVQRAFRERPHRIVGELPNTWASALNVLALPLYAHMTPEQQERVCTEIESLMRRGG